MSEKPVIGFIGLGLMGAGMAKNIRKAGHDLWVRDPFNAAALERLKQLGATEATSPRQMAENCTIVHISVPTSAHVEEVITGKDGILEAARPGLIVIDTSTSDPASTMKLAGELAAKGTHLIDAALGRTPKEAESGQLDAMVGCDAAMFDTVRPIIASWAGTITRIGDVGSGHKMKLLMNFIGLTYGALYSEAVVLGAKVGISPATLREVIGPSRMGNGFFETFMRYVVDRDPNAHQFTIANAAKDIRYINSMASNAGVMNIVASATQHYYEHAEATGHAKDFLPTLSDRVASLNGITLDRPAVR